MTTPKNGPIALSAEDFYRLDAAQGRVSSTKLDLLEQVEPLKRALREAEARRNALLSEMAAKYGFDPAGAYEWDEATFSLVPVPGDQHG